MRCFIWNRGSIWLSTGYEKEECFGPLSQKGIILDSLPGAFSASSIFVVLSACKPFNDPCIFHLSLSGHNSDGGSKRNYWMRCSRRSKQAIEKNCRLIDTCYNVIYGKIAFQSVGYFQSLIRIVCVQIILNQRFQLRCGGNDHQIFMTHHFV